MGAFFVRGPKMTPEMIRRLRELSPDPALREMIRKRRPSRDPSVTMLYTPDPSAAAAASGARGASTRARSAELGACNGPRSCGRAAERKEHDAAS